MQACIYDGGESIGYFASRCVDIVFPLLLCICMQLCVNAKTHRRKINHFCCTMSKMQFRAQAHGGTCITNTKTHVCVFVHMYVDVCV